MIGTKNIMLIFSLCHKIKIFAQDYKVLPIIIFVFIWYVMVEIMVNIYTQIYIKICKSKMNMLKIKK